MAENSTSAVLKGICRNIFIVGVGEFWHEPTEKPKWQLRIYSFLSYFVIVILLLFFALEVLEVVFDTFPPDEHRDCISYAMAHLTVFVKLYLFKKNKNKIKVLLRNIIDVCNGFEKAEVLLQQRQLIRFAMFTQVFIIYSALTFYNVEAVRRCYVDGEIFVSVITYLPHYEDRSLLAFVFRIFLILIMYYLMAFMILTEMLGIAHIIIVALKFVTIRKYFEDIGEQFLNNFDKEPNKELLIIKLKNDILRGLIMHRQLLSVFKQMDDVFGNIVSIQVCQSSGVAVTVLIRLAFQEHPAFANFLMSFFFLCALIIQLAIFLLTAGDITYNASYIPDAIFYCGWYMCPVKEAHHADLRKIVLIGLVQSQTPVILKAFKVKDLSYETFVSVLRSTYSIFALFH